VPAIRDWVDRWTALPGVAEALAIDIALES